MLKDLIIKNIVLISHLQMNFSKGFTVLTGETGAGKSILLDSLGLLLGNRANYSLIRNGCDFAEIIGVFSISNNHIVKDLLRDNFITFHDDDLILKRIITSDSKSKSFINDTPVSLNLMKLVGDLMIDIHGQFDNHKLFNNSYHQEILDGFLSDKNLSLNVRTLFESYQNATKIYENKKQALIDVENEKEYLQHSLQELRELNPQENEENLLVEQKVLLQKSQKIINQINSIKSSLVDSDILYDINKSLKQLQALQVMLNNQDVEDTIKSIEDGYVCISNGIEVFGHVEKMFSFQGNDSQQNEERLMELRSIAKKHKVLPNDLYLLIDEFENKLTELFKSQDTLDELLKNKNNAYDLFINQAILLSEMRKNTAKILDEKINGELHYLKLSSAEFKTIIEQCDPYAGGIDRVFFKVKTNHGGTWGDLNRVASGGEMARFMLSLKMIISQNDIINTIIFDEIDIGVGGDVAQAIGERLLFLSKSLQTIVVTHSHQVASKGEHHIKVIKEVQNNQTFTKLYYLDAQQRVEEIARMLAGSEITDQERKTALNLLK